MPFTPTGIPFDVPAVGTVAWSPGAGNDVIPAIPAGGFYDLNLDGRELDQTELRPFLPFLNALISNQSSSRIRVQLGDQRRSSFTVDPKRAVPVSDLPMIKLRIENLGNTPIAAEEITITMTNDQSGVKNYVELCERGLLYPFILPLDIRRVGDPRRVF